VIGRYYDPTRECSYETNLRTAAELHQALRELAALSGDRGVPALELADAGGGTLAMAQTAEGTLLMYTDPLGASYHSVGSSEACGLSCFDYFGTSSEVPNEYLVDHDKAIEAAVEYLTVGSLHHSDVVLEPD
jgi:Immunity protein Imm1